MKLIWLIVSGVAIALAAVFLWRGDFNTAFVIAAIGLVAWFLNYRMQLQDASAEREIQVGEEIEDDSQN